MNKVLEYIIRAKDATGGAISSALGRLKSFASGVGRQLANVKAGLDMALGAASRFARVFASAIGEAFRFEKAVSDFRVLLKSADAAKEHIADLRRFASSTPLTFGDLSQASKLLLSFGASVGEVMPSLRMLGDIAMGDRQKFQGLALVFAQVKAAGKLMGQDLLQMINQGSNPLTVIAQQTGKSMSDLKDLMAEGAISFEMVAEAMRVATSEGGLFHGAMEEASKTGEGLVSTLQDKWTDTVRTFGEAFSGAAKGGLQTLIDKLTELVENGTVEVWAEKVVGALEKVVDGASACAKAVGAVWNYAGLSDMWHAVKGARDGVGAAVGTLVGSIAGGGGVWETTKATAGAFALAFNDEIAKGFYSKKAGKAGWGGEGLRLAVDADEAHEAEIRERAKRKSRKAAGGGGNGGGTPGKSLADMLAEAEAKAREKEARERERERAAAERAAERLAREEERERLAVERAIAKERARLQKETLDEYREGLEAARTAEADAMTRLAAAQERERQAWGWYRDKDSLAAQIEEEKADAAARKQFDRDFARLADRRRDWRTATDLSLDDEAVRRVGLAREEREAAEKAAAETAANTARAAASLEAIERAFQEGGE